jgi:hypothetical protein
MKTRKGFGALEIIGVLAVVTLVGFLGYTAFMRYEGQMASTKTTPIKQPADTAVAPKLDDVTIATAPEIAQTADLEKASSTLDDINIDSADDDAQLGRLVSDMN